jgi:choline-sulfatase
VNFLVVVADQLSPRALPPYGNRVVKAPAISRLAEEGVVFEHAYCNFPLCAPSRASFMTGRLASRVGVYDNGAEFAASIPTLAHRLRARGYRTSLAGKMHFIGPDQLHGFEQRLTPDIYPAGLNWVPDWSRPLSDRFEWYHDMTSVFDAGVSAGSLQRDYDDEVAFRSVRAIFDFARAKDGRPFLHIASFSEPHDPWEVPAEYWNRYEGVEIDHPRVGQIADSDLDPHSRRVREMCGALGLEVPDDKLMNARRGHYASISYVDDKVADLLEALDTTGLRDDTVVVFMADHGEMLGERGDWYKMSFFEPSATVPLIVHAPHHFSPRRVSANVSLLDLGPTLLDLTGTAIGDDLDGSSLAPHLAGPVQPDRPVMAEYLAEGAVAPVVMLKQGRLKFIHSSSDPDLLFDLEHDPDELRNVARDPAYAGDVKVMRDEVARRWDLPALHERIVESQRQRHLIGQAMQVGPAPEWDYEHQDGTAGREGPYVRGSNFWAPFERARLRR